MDDHSRTSYICPSLSTAPLSLCCLSSKCPLSNVLSLFFFFFFFWHVVQSGVFQSWRFVFQERRHVVFPGWSHRFKCQPSLPINSRIPPYPSHFKNFRPWYLSSSTFSRSFFASIVLFRLEPSILFILVFRLFL